MSTLFFSRNGWLVLTCSQIDSKPELKPVDLNDAMEFKNKKAIVNLERYSNIVGSADFFLVHSHLFSKIRYALHTGSEKELVSLGAGEVSRVLLLELPEGTPVLIFFNLAIFVAKVAFRAL